MREPRSSSLTRLDALLSRLTVVVERLEALPPAPASSPAPTSEAFYATSEVDHWIFAHCELDAQARAGTQELFGDFCAYLTKSGRRGVTQKMFAMSLVRGGYPRWKHPRTRRAGFVGLRLRGGGGE